MIRLLAEAISTANKDKQAYVMQDTTTGLYLGCHYSMVKTKRIALRVVTTDPNKLGYSVPTWEGVEVSNLKAVKYNRKNNHKWVGSSEI